MRRLLFGIGAALVLLPLACAALALLALLALVAVAPGAGAQKNHDLYHITYKEWMNQNGHGCCNDRDCGELAERDERETNGAIEVRIEGQWCPIKPWMYLKKGNAPNWSMSHVCVVKAYYGDDDGQPLPVCDRLKCYQPKPGF